MVEEQAYRDRFVRCFRGEDLPSDEEKGSPGLGLGLKQVWVKARAKVRLLRQLNKSSAKCFLQ